MSFQLRGKLQLVKRAFIVILLLIFVTLYSNPMQPKKRILVVGFPAEWNSRLIPPLQHSAIAAAVLSNEFEPLITVGKGGQTLPLAAKRWQIEPGYKEVIFEIDTTRTFSDGSKLEAQDFKNAWEQGLRMVPRSNNSSLLDFLGFVEGYEDFEKNGELKGVAVLSPSRLEIKFKQPFRTALKLISSYALSVFKMTPTGPIGTGPYVIKSNNGREIDLEPNKFSESKIGFSEVIIRYVTPDSAMDKMLTGEIDLMAYAESSDIECKDSEKFSCYEGVESAHSLYMINSVDGHIFSDSNMRKAIQAIFHKSLIKIKPETYDPQVYLPLQAGRLEEKEAVSIILQGEKYISDLQARSEKTPITILASGGRETIKMVESILSHSKVNFKKTKQVDFKELLQQVHKKYEYDIVLMGSSVHNGDPDGIYHKLGDKGAIASKISYRKRTIPLLEEGRKILDQKRLHGHYQKVNRAILEDVPFIHAGFRTTKIFFNSKVVKEKSELKERNDTRFSSFEPAR